MLISYNIYVMAWHILHGLLEQVRHQSTFPGKLWIVTMFVFRIVVVARIGEEVYHDEQSSFVCNTQTPGCTNVCFNRFSPISQLRYWSLMVLVVATPTILFFLYAMHAVFHADIKYPYKKDENNLNVTSKKPTLEVAPYKRKRESFTDAKSASQTPLYVVTKISKSPQSGRRLGKFLRKRRHVPRDNDPFLKKSISDNNADEIVFPDRHNLPIYGDAHSRHFGVMKGKKEPASAEEREAMLQRKYKSKMMQHPELARAYWWHVVLRTITEVASILGQYYLYGFTVAELYECRHWPCPKTVDCFVSRPQEKTCLLWLMYGLGVFACLLSIAEFWTLGFGKLKNAFVCCTEETYEERKRRLAMLNVEQPKIKPALSVESISSDSTVESV